MERKKLLVIEDSKTQAIAIAAQLSSFDVDVILAHDGPQGLRMIAGMKPDLVILDVNLPSMNGYQVCRRVKRDPDTANIPIIMLTAAMSPEETKEGLAAGADDYIHKDGEATQNVIAAAFAHGLISQMPQS